VPTLPRPGWVVRFAQIQRDFWRSMGGGSRLCMSLKVHRISSLNTSRKCVCPLQIVYAYLASGGFAPRPPPGICPWIPLGDFRSPDPLCPPYVQTLATPLETIHVSRNVVRLSLYTNSRRHFKLEDLTFFILNFRLHLIGK